MARPAPGAVVTRLRPVREADLARLAAWAAEPTSEYDDFSGPPPPGVVDAPRVKPPGFGELVVTDDDDVPLGTVGWHTVHYGPGSGSTALSIGISLRPEARGLGHGSRSQRMLADYLFATTRVNRVEASTDVRNVAEQKALERGGFTREGVMRGAQWRQGSWHDLVGYARLRGEP